VAAREKRGWGGKRDGKMAAAWHDIKLMKVIYSLRPGRALNSKRAGINSFTFRDEAVKPEGANAPAFNEQRPTAERRREGDEHCYPHACKYRTVGHLILIS